MVLAFKTRVQWQHIIRGGVNLVPILLVSIGLASMNRTPERSHLYGIILTEEYFTVSILPLQVLNLLKRFGFRFPVMGGGTHSPSASTMRSNLFGVERVAWCGETHCHSETSLQGTRLLSPGLFHSPMPGHKRSSPTLVEAMQAIFGDKEDGSQFLPYSSTGGVCGLRINFSSVWFGAWSRTSGEGEELVRSWGSVQLELSMCGHMPCWLTSTPTVNRE